MRRPPRRLSAAPCRSPLVLWRPCRIRCRRSPPRRSGRTRIALRDLSGRATFAQSANELSTLAAASFEAAVRFHYARLCAAHGPPEGRSADGPSGFCVLGMGKLGGDELNFSSDVDVLYVYD